MIKGGVGHKAAGDLELFNRIAAHRQVYFRYSWVDYDTLCPGRLRIVPTDEQIAVWKADYTAMKNEMFYGTPPEFEDLIEKVRKFQNDFNNNVNA